MVDPLIAVVVVVVVSSVGSTTVLCLPLFRLQARWTGFTSSGATTLRSTLMLNSKRVIAPTWLVRT